MKKRLHNYIIFLILLTCNTFVNAQWERLPGVYGGRINEVCVDSTTIYTTNIYSGPHRSIDSAKTWQAINSGLIDDSGYRTFHTTAANGNLIFTGTYDDGIFKSEDYGTTWSDVNNGVPLLGQQYGRIYDLIFCDSVLVCIIADSIKRFDFNSEIWLPVEVTLGNSDARSLKKIQNSVYLLNSNGIYVSENNCNTWSFFANIPVPYYQNSVAVKDSLIILAKDSSRVYISKNQGQTWELKNVSTNTFGISDIIIFNGYIFVSSPNRGIYRSSDHGDTWDHIIFGHKDWNPSSFSVLGNILISGGNYGNGVFLSYDSGDNWVAMNNKMEDVPVFDIDKIDTMMFVATGAGLYIGKQYGDSLVPTSIDDRWIINITTNNNILFASEFSYYGGGVLKSFDYGQNWSLYDSGNMGIHIDALITSNNSLYAGSFYGLYKSNNNSSSWYQSSNGLTDFFGHACEVNGISANGDTLVALTDHDGVFLSTDGANSWSDITNNLPLPVHYSDIAIKGTTIFSECHNYYGLHRSQNMGQTWQSVNNGLYTAFGNLGDINEIYVNDSAVFISNDSTGIFFSKDNGDSWIPIQNGTEKMVASCLYTDDLYLYAGCSNGLWRYPLSIIYSIEEFQHKKSSFIVYPNPTNGKFTISKTDFDEVIIINNVRQVILRSNEKDIDISSYSSGLYFIKVLNEKEEITGKLIKE